MATLFKVQATHDYSSAEVDDLSFKDGEIIAVTEEIDAEWYMGFYEDEHGEKRSGMFPKVFIRPYEPKAPARPTRPRPVQPEPAVTETAEDTAPSSKTVPATSPEMEQDHGSATRQRPLPNVEQAAAPASPLLPEVKQQAPGLPTSSKPPPPPVAGKPGSLKDRIGMFNNPGSAPPKPIGLVPKPKPAQKPFIPAAPSSGAYVNVPKKPPVKVRPEEPIQDQTPVDRSEQAEGPQDEGPRLTLKQRKELLEKEQASHRLPNPTTEPSKNRTDRGSTKESAVAPNSPPSMETPRVPPPIPTLPKAPTEIESGSVADKDPASDEIAPGTSGTGDAQETSDVEDIDSEDLPRTTRIGSHRSETQPTPLSEDKNNEESVVDELQPSEEDAEAARKRLLRDRMARLAGQGAFSPFASKPTRVMPQPKPIEPEAPEVPEDEAPVPMPMPRPIIPMPKLPSDSSEPAKSFPEEEEDDGAERPMSPIERPASPSVPVSPKPLPQPPSPSARPKRTSTERTRNSMDDSKSIRSLPPPPVPSAPSVPTNKPEGPRPPPPAEPISRRPEPLAVPEPPVVPDYTDDAAEETDHSEEYDGDYDTDIHDAGSVKFPPKREPPFNDPGHRPSAPPPPPPSVPHAPPPTRPPQPPLAPPQLPSTSRMPPPPVPPPRAPDNHGLSDDNSDLDVDEPEATVERLGSPAIQPSDSTLYHPEQSEQSRQRQSTVQPVLSPPQVPASITSDSARRSLNKPSIDMSRSSIGMRPSLDQGNTARAISLDNTTPWWTYPNTPPPDFQNRTDILIEIEDISRPRHHRIERTVVVVFPDYSQTEVKAAYDTRRPDGAELTQEHFPPPPAMRQDQLENVYGQYGDPIVNAVRLMQTKRMGDGSPMALILESFKSIPDALAPIGNRSFGALVYENMSNASVKSHDEIRPGDIVSMRNAKFQGKHGIKNYSKELREHVGIVDEWDGAKKKIYAWEQGREGKNDKKGVDRESYKVSDLKSGEIKVWRVVGRTYVGFGA